MSCMVTETVTLSGRYSRQSECLRDFPGRASPAGPGVLVLPAPDADTEAPSVGDDGMELLLWCMSVNIWSSPKMFS